VSSYTEDEKVNIATRYLIPKALKNNGLKERKSIFQKPQFVTSCAITCGKPGCAGWIVSCPKFAVSRQGAGAQGACEQGHDQCTHLDKYLGVRHYSYGIAEKVNQVGQVTGLAWTEVGGSCLRLRLPCCRARARLQLPQAGRGDARVYSGRTERGS